MLPLVIVVQLRDVRPYAQVEMLEKTVVGLLDTGASVNCIGRSLVETRAK